MTSFRPRRPMAAATDHPAPSLPDARERRSRRRTARRMHPWFEAAYGAAILLACAAAQLAVIDRVAG